MGKIEISQENMIIIIDLMHSGCSLREVLGALEIAKTSFRNIWQKYLKGISLKIETVPVVREFLPKETKEEFWYLLKGILSYRLRNF